MSQKTLFDADSEEFQMYFAHEMESISTTAKADIPKDVAFKLFRGGGKVDTKSTSKLSFLAKLYILWKCLNKRWWVLIEDEQNGITPGQFMELRKAYKRKDYGTERAAVLKSYGSFVLADKELATTLTYLNRLSSSGAYNYLIKAKNSPKSKSAEDDKERTYIAKFLANYDAQKKTMVTNCKLTVPEFYVLITLYDGKPIEGVSLYKEKFKRAYQSSPSKIKLAFGTLQSRGLVAKNGTTRGSTLQITSSGKELLNSIFEKYILNC